MGCYIYTKANIYVTMSCNGLKTKQKNKNNIRQQKDEKIVVVFLMLCISPHIFFLHIIYFSPIHWRFPLHGILLTKIHWCCSLHVMLLTKSTGVFPFMLCFSPNPLVFFPSCYASHQMQWYFSIHVLFLTEFIVFTFIIVYVMLFTKVFLP